MGRTGSRLRGGWRMVGALSTVLALLLPLLLLPSPAVPAARAQHGGIMLPFEAGAEWFVSQGYNTSPEEGWSHYNCDPRTGKDEISQSSRCDDGWQYKYSFDLRRVDGEEAGQPVLSPASGVVRWVDPAYGGLSLDLGDGFAVAFFHVDLARGIAAGDELRVGQRVGHVSGPGGGGNGGTPHIHLTVWATEDGGNWSRTSVPFAGDHPLEGQAFPALPERERNQYLNAVLASSNAPAAPAATPEAPLPVAPADGAVVARRAGLEAFVWEPVLDAAEYQVVLDGGARTGPWLNRTRWDPGDLPAGTYTWQVKARNDAGESPLSPASTLTVAADDRATTPEGTPAATPVATSVVPPETTPAATPASRPAATPGEIAQAVGPPTLNLAAARATVGTLLTTNGAGFAPGEQVRLVWDGASGPLVAEATANDGGAFTVSVPIPAAPAGDHEVLAEGAASGATAEGSVEVIPSIAAEPAIAAPGAEVEVTLRGFGAAEPLALTRSGEGDQDLGAGQTDANGSATLTFSAPEAEAGLYDLFGVGGESGGSALGAFRLDGAGGAPSETTGDGRMTSPGTFRVTSTVLGLIGGTTSSGEIIDAEDRLIALPACTNTSCPWLAPGVEDDLFGTRIECGDDCFVRVANPETGSCAVAPVLETGPWFTLDDWWNPTAERALNRLPGTTSRLAQGYPGAEAAQDGLDVGYGRSPDGVGISNKGYVVGNRAALDLSNRTWQDIGLDLAVGVAEIEATVLWISGEDPAEAARACGSPIDRAEAATPTASPAPASPAPATAVASVGGSSGGTADRSETPRAAGGGRADRSRSDAPAGRDAERESAGRGADAEAEVAADAEAAASADAEAAASAGRDGESTTTAVGAAGEPQAVPLSGEPDENSPAAAPTGDLPSDERARSLRGYRSAERGAVEREQQTTGDATTDGVGIDAGTSTVVDAGASGQYSGPPLPPRLAARLPRPGAGPPATAMTGASRPGSVPSADSGTGAAGPGPGPASATESRSGSPPFVPPAPNLEGLVIGSVPSPPQAEPEPTSDADADAERDRPREGAAPETAGTAAAETPVPSESSSAAPGETGVESGTGTGTGTGTESESESGSHAAGARDVATDPAPDVSADEDEPTPDGPIRNDAGEPDGNGRRDEGDAPRQAGNERGGTNDEAAGDNEAALGDDAGRDAESARGGEDGRGGANDGGGDDRSGASRRRNDDDATTPQTTATPVTEETPAEPVVTPIPASAQEPTTPTPTEPLAAVEPEPIDPAEAEEAVVVEPAAIDAAASETTAPTATAGPAEATAVPPVPAEPVPASPEPAGSAAPNDAPSSLAETTPPPAEATPPPAAPPASPTAPPVTATPDPTPLSPTPTTLPVAATPNTTPPSPVPTAPPIAPTVAPVAASPDPTPAPAATAPIETRVFLPVSDTTVWTSDATRVQQPMQVSVLPVGGPDGAVAYLTFQVEGLAPGSLVSARLVLVGAIGFGGPLSVGALPGVWVDEAGLTSGTAPGGDWPAIGAGGAQAAATPIWLGSEAVFDVSGTVTADGAVTFVVRGTPDAGQALGSRESGIPARLEVEAGWVS